ncbi:hypothetical protein dsx2_2973 [Desulfovibrio sp. X2]|uniref:hypothetical protein n=1 Tax=Desulfovibrio sp. X2 TaxID=941449 RepID=UPI000358E908|nr:hypothetical protein [Desulfovibrio sp. X2]EPR41969.1 hypothetical protein dsx2_2973 [Desulfovibrio sp. X2]
MHDLINALLGALDTIRLLAGQLVDLRMGHAWVRAALHVLLCLGWGAVAVLYLPCIVLGLLRGCRPVRRACLPDLGAAENIRFPAEAMPAERPEERPASPNRPDQARSE